MGERQGEGGFCAACAIIPRHSGGNRNPDLECSRLQRQPLLESGVSPPHNEPIFFACPKKMGEKKGHPRTPALRLPCALPSLRSPADRPSLAWRRERGHPVRAPSGLTLLGPVLDVIHGVSKNIRQHRLVFDTDLYISVIAQVEKITRVPATFATGFRARLTRNISSCPDNDLAPTI